MSRRRQRGRKQRKRRYFVALLACVMTLIAVWLASGGLPGLRSTDEHLAIAKEQLAAGNTAGAIENLRLILSRDPEHAVARAELLDAYLKIGNGANALRQIDWLSENAPRPGLDDDRLHALITLGRYDEVIELTDGLPSNSDWAKNLRAWSFLQLDDLESAWQAYQDLLNSSPGNPAGRLGLARVALPSRDFSTALPHVMAVLESDQSYGDAWLVLGDLLVGLRRYAEAEQAYTRAGALGADNLTSTIGTARALLGQGKIETAIDLSKQLTEQFPTITEVRLLNGEIAEAQGQLDVALQLYQGVLAIQPNHMEANERLGSIAFRKGNVATASSYLSAVINLSPSSVNARLLRAEIERRAGREESARAMLAEAFQLASVSPGDFYLLCPAKPAALSYEEFARLIEFWLEAEPNDHAARLALAIEAEILGDYAAATRHYQLVLDAVPDNAVAQQRLHAIPETTLAATDPVSRSVEREQSNLSSFRCSR